MTPQQIKDRENYLFKIAKKTLEYYGVEYEYDMQSLADLVMLELLNIKE